MASQLAKWLAYYCPLFRGRFDFFLSAGAPRREAWHQGLALTGGRFWVRIHGGHDLRRTATCLPGWQPSRSDVLAGRSDGSTATVTTFPWVNHEAGGEYFYALSAVGGGGVVNPGKAPSVRICFDAAGALVDPGPNAVRDLSVRAVAGGRFLLRWTYDERDQPAAPTVFRVYNDAGSPGEIDYSTPVGTAAYRFRQTYFRWTSSEFADGSRGRWAVRAATAAGVEGPPSDAALGIASGGLPA